MAKDEEKTSQARSYAERMNVMQVDIGEVVPLLKKCYELRRSFVPLLVGHAGIGKTASWIEAGRQLEEELGKPFEVRVSLTSSRLPEDYAGIPVPMHKDKLIDYYRMAELPSEGYGILCFDELNRCDQDTLKPIINFLSSFSIRDYSLPEGWAIGAAMNPDEDLYNVVRTEPALRRRLMIMEVVTSGASWLKWAQENDLHASVFNYIRKYPKTLLDMAALQNEKVFANPSAWEKVSTLLKTVTKQNINTFRPLIAGYVGNEYAQGVIKEFLSLKIEEIDPLHVLYNFEEIKSALSDYIKEGKLDVVSTLINAVPTALELFMKDKEKEAFEKPEGKQIADNIAKFYKELPNDLAVVFGQNLNNLTHLHKILTEHPESRSKLLTINRIVKATSVKK